MSEPLWSDERVMGRYRDFIECNGAEYVNVAWQSVIREMRDEYEAALDEARIAGLDAAVADGETLDAWKERAWKAEQENAKHMAIAERCLARAAYFETKLADRVAMLERVQREGQGEL